MSFSDFHTHTVFSDGRNTPEEMILAAIEKGMDKIGISDHAYTFFDESYCIKKKDIERYQRSINELKEKYADRIQVYCGIEQDIDSEMPVHQYDYVIGSVHYLYKNGKYLPVDESLDLFQKAIENDFAGDVYAMAEAYFERVSKVVEVTNADIIGHFDLISKFNENSRFFDENHPRYVAAWKSAADQLLKTGKPFEINTGAISRGYRTSPYPSMQIIRYLSERGASFVLSSDAHTAQSLCYRFPEMEQFIKKA